MILASSRAPIAPMLADVSPFWLSGAAAAALAAGATAPPDEPAGSELVADRRTGPRAGPRPRRRAGNDDEGDRADREQKTDGAHLVALRGLAATERSRGIAETPGQVRRFHEVHSGRGTPAPVPAAARADARESGRRAAVGRRLAVRAEVGRLPGAGLPRRRRGLHAVARPEAARSLLPGAGGAAAGRPAGALRARRRGRHLARRRARLRGPAAAHPSGRIAGPDAGRGVAGELRRLGPARAR